MKKIALLALLVVAVACNDRLVEKPDNLIPKAKMIRIIKEMALVKAAKSSKAVILKQNNIDPKTYVFNKFKIDSAQFVLSDKFYASIPSDYEFIYMAVEEELKSDIKEQQQLKKVSDSLKQIEKVALKEKLKKKDKKKNIKKSVQ